MHESLKIIKKTSVVGIDNAEYENNRIQKKLMLYDIFHCEIAAKKVRKSSATLPTYLNDERKIIRCLFKTFELDQTHLSWCSDGNHVHVQAELAALDTGNHGSDRRIKGEIT